jgi:hypothetical protein
MSQEHKDCIIKLESLKLNFGITELDVKTKKIYFIIYKTINLSKQEGDQYQFYVGKHIQHDDLDFDGYYGSGTKLNEQIRECGKEVFKREILEICDFEKELVLKEMGWISSLYANYYKYPDCGGMNKTNGGEFTYGVGLIGDKAPFYNKKCTEEHKRKISISNKGRKLSPESIQRHKKSKMGKYVGENNPMYGQHHTEETKRKMSEKIKNLFKHDKNPNCKYNYILSNGENYWEFFNKKDRGNIKNTFNRKKTNTIEYKGIVITRTLKESDNK